MSKRVLFKSKLARDTFFEIALEKSELKLWSHIRKSNNIPRATFEGYRNGRTSLPYEVYQKIIKKFNDKEIRYFSDKVDLLEEYWGRVIGGKNAYKKNKELFEEGRKKGIKKILELKPQMSLKFINQPIDRDLAYFAGLLIGDGFTNKYGRYYLTQFIGHKTYELQYYREIICKYVIETLGLVPNIIESKKGNFIRVNIYSKNLFYLLTKEIGIPPGRKSRIVLIPEKILSSEKEILLSCIAGIYDAEGCIFMDKRKEYLKPYPRIDLHMLNIPILKQIKESLTSEEIKCSLSSVNSNNSRLLIYGETNVKRFLSKVPIKNPKHISKLKEAKLL